MCTPKLLPSLFFNRCNRMQSHASLFKFFSNAGMIVSDLVGNLFLLDMLSNGMVNPSWPPAAVS